MKRELLAVLAVAVGLLMGSGPLLAHHSTALYEKQHVTTLQGTVTALEFINPHVQIRFEVKDSQRSDDAALCIGHKDGRTIISVEKVVLSNGKELPMRSLD